MPRRSGRGADGSLESRPPTNAQPTAPAVRSREHRIVGSGSTSQSGKWSGAAPRERSGFTSLPGFPLDTPARQLIGPSPLCAVSRPRKPAASHFLKSLAKQSLNY